MKIINKIWSKESLLTDKYTNKLVRKAVRNSKGELEFNEQLLGQHRKTALLSQRIGLTLGLVVPGLHRRIIKAFSTVQILKDKSSLKQPEAQELPKSSALKVATLKPEIPPFVAKNKISPKQPEAQKPVQRPALKEPELKPELPAPLKQPEVKPEIPAIVVEVPKVSFQEQMVKDIQAMIHEDVAGLWKGVFDKFNPENIKSWKCDAEGNFKLELIAPMRLWTPSRDATGKQDPTAGNVLTFGLNDDGAFTGVIQGKLDRAARDMRFSEGINVFIKPDDPRAKPGFSKLTNIRYSSQNEVHLVTKKDLKKDYSGFMLSIVASFAKKHGTVDKDYNLIVDKNRTLSNMIENWNREAKVVENEKTAVGVKL